MLKLECSSLDGGVGWAKKIGRRAPVSARESVEAYTPHEEERSNCIAERGGPSIQIEKWELKVEAYTPHHEERRRAIALRRGGQSKLELKVEAYKLPCNLELLTEVKLKHTVQHI